MEPNQCSPEPQDKKFSPQLRDKIWGVAWGRGNALHATSRKLRVLISFQTNRPFKVGLYLYK